MIDWISRALLGSLLVPALAASSPLAAQPIGPDAAACSDPRAAAVLVRLNGFKNGSGSVRVQAYGGNAADFLAKGKWVRRVEAPLNGTGPIEVCIRLPAPGRYAIAIRHDANANRKSDWNDGAGFSRNPRLSLFSPKPAFEQVVLPVGRGVTRISVTMNYRHGLSIGPERGR